MATTDAERRMSMACKYETSNGRCGLKGCYAYRHKCYTEDMCKCHEPPTNADRIRAMSDDELKEFICSILQCKFCKFEGFGCCELLKWLQQPAEGE